MAPYFGSSTGTAAAAVAATVDIAVDGFSRLSMLVRNTGATNAIGTNAVLVSMDGTNFKALSAVGTAIGSISTSSSVVVDLGNLCAKVVRVSMTSSSGSTYSVEWCAIGGNANGALECSVNGNAVGAQSVSGDFQATNITATGDLAAAGGFRQQVGPFYVTTAADQTAVGTKLGDTVSQTWIAPFAGSVMAASGMIDAAVTGSGKTIKARVYKNGTLLNAALDLDFTQAGAEVLDYATVAKDTYTFAAGDALNVVYTSTTITNTPELVVFLTVEC